jgi:hypothetical protein
MRLILHMFAWLSGIKLVNANNSNRREKDACKFYPTALKPGPVVTPPFAVAAARKMMKKPRWAFILDSFLEVGGCCSRPKSPNCNAQATIVGYRVIIGCSLPVF